MAVSLVQTQSGNGGAYTNSYTFTFTGNVAAGSLLVLNITAGTADSILSISDNHTNGWFSVINSNNSSGGRQSFLWAAYNAAAGATTVTITFASGTYPDSAFIAREYSGMATTLALDATAYNTDGSGYVQTHDAGTTGVTAQASELVILGGGVGASSEPTLVAGTGYSNGLEQKGFDAYTYSFLSDKIVSSTGAQSGNFLSSGYVSGQGFIATFKAASGGSAVNASVSAAAAAITAAGGTQAVATVRKIAVAQAAATLTAHTGTQVASTGQVAAISQSAAVITAYTGTQALASVAIAAISQVAAAVTATGGVQSNIASPPGAINTPNWYKYGQLPNKTVSTLVADITGFWTSQLKPNYLVQTGMPSGMPSGAWRVKRPENSNDTVSEGMGYAMVLAAYLGNPSISGYDSGAHAIFDGLWQYVNYYLDSNGLMNWHIDSSGNIMSGGTGSATDGDYDIAWGLHIASQIWGNAGTYNYAALRDSYLAGILAYDIYSASNSNTAIRNVQINGDAWDSSQSGSPDWFDPDYFAPAYFGAWATLNGRWSTIKSANYPIYNATDTHNTGLIPDQQTRAGAAVSGQSYENGYNAIRRFRQVLDYLWYGSTQPNFIDYYQHKHTADFIATQSGGVVANQYAEYAIDGSTNGGYSNKAFSSSYMVTMLINSDHSTLAGATIDSIVASPDGSYFGDFVAAMGLLTASGLFVPNPAVNATVTQSHAAIVANAGTQAVGTLSNGVVAQAAAAITANTGTQTVAGNVNASISQVGAAVTANAGTQTATTSASISQAAAVITAQGGTQIVGAALPASVAQTAASVTATGGTQSIGGVISATIAQSAANITAHTGTQVVATVRKIAIAQLKAAITAGVGTQVVVAQRVVSIAQVGGSITATTGVQAVAGVIYGSASIAQVAAAITATTGAQIVSTVIIGSASITQIGANVTAGAGQQSVATVNDIVISQIAAIVSATPGVPFVGSLVDAEIDQIAASLVVVTGQQSVATTQIGSVAQLAATITAAGGQTLVDGVGNTFITQIAAVVTATDGTQQVNAKRMVSIGQAAVSIAIVPGVQAIATVRYVAITQIKAAVTAMGGGTSVQEVNNAMVMPPAASVVATPGTPAVATIRTILIGQVTASITAHGGTQIIATSNYVQISQTMAQITAAPGDQSFAAQIATAVAQRAALVAIHTGLQIVAGSNTIRVWNGTAYVAKPVKIWDGNAWTQRPVKRYNAAGAWV